MIKLTLTSGETLTGTPNYADRRILDLKLANGSFRTIRRDQITARQRVTRRALGHVTADV